MDPYLEGTSVIVKDPAVSSSLMNKGSFGTALPGGGLRLDLLEATYLCENERMGVRSAKGRRSYLWSDLLEKGARSDRSFLSRYVTYRDLRNRGLVVRIGGEGSFLLYPRGTKGLKAKPSGWVSTNIESDAVHLNDLRERVRSDEGTRIDTLCAVVDADWDVTFYHVSSSGILEVRGQGEKTGAIGPIEPGDLTLTRIPGSGTIASGKAITSLRERSMIGSAIRDVTLLSREEEMLLREAMGEPPSKDRDLRWTVFKELMVAGLIPRSGLKYGCHFRVYPPEGASGHSRYLVQCMDGGTSVGWEELTRSIRLCHSVRKRMVYAFLTPGYGAWPDQSHLAFLEMEWVRP